MIWKKQKQKWIQGQEGSGSSIWLNPYVPRATCWKTTPKSFQKRKIPENFHWFPKTEMYSELQLKHFFFFIPTWSFSIIRHELLGDRSHAGVWCSIHMSSDIFASLSLRQHHEGPVRRCQTQPQLLMDSFFPAPLLVFDPNGGVSVCLLTPKRAPATAFILTAVCRFAGIVKLINLPALTWQKT